MPPFADQFPWKQKTILLREVAFVSGLELGVVCFFLPVCSLCLELSHHNDDVRLGDISVVVQLFCVPALVRSSIYQISFSSQNNQSALHLALLMHCLSSD